MLKTFVKTVAGLACLALAASPTPAKAIAIAPASIPERVALAQVVVVGKVGKVEDKNVSTTRFPGATDKVEYQIVGFKVEDGLMGAKDAKEIRVGFVPPQGNPGGLIRPGRGPSVVLTTDQECCLFLTKHHAEDFYVPMMYFDVIDKKSNTFDKDVEEAKRCCKLLADPDAGFKSKEAEDRFLTAAMLTIRYRTNRTGSTKTEDVPAEQSKLILKTLADADWTPPGQPGGPVVRPGFQLTPQAVFFRLGLTEKDGWKQPQDFNKLPDEAKKWLKENAETYKMQRFVAETKEKKD
jgi:hypothetical protein